jgi:isopenicillin N synthase-like dioxygenase
MKASSVLAEPTDTILKQGWMLIDFDVETLSQPVIRGWNRFIAESPDFKKTWTIPSKSKEGPDNGYVPREGEVCDGKAYDLKEFFHYRPYLPMLLEEQGVDFTPYRDWLLACDALYRSCRRHAFTVAHDWNEIVPGENFCDLMQNPYAECRHVLRLLSYTQAPSLNTELGKMHVDRNFLTLHVWENIPGLEVKQSDGSIHQYTAVPGKILVFPGKKAHAFTQGTLRGLPHGIVGRELTDTAPKRQSIVSFWHIDCPY